LGQHSDRSPLDDLSEGIVWIEASIQIDILDMIILFYPWLSFHSFLPGLSFQI